MISILCDQDNRTTLALKADYGTHLRLWVIVDLDLDLDVDIDYPVRHEFSQT